VEIRIGQEGPPSGSPAGAAGPHRVLSTFGPTATASVDEKNATAFGAVALYAGGPGEVRFKDVAWKDLMRVATGAEQVSPRFTIRRLNTGYYGWGAATSDVNHDGTLDVISGPFYYLGPNFTEQRRYREGPLFNPESSFAPDMVNLSADFTGDGWPDVLSSLGNRHMDLYVNPAGESRRWDKFSVLPTISSEIVLLKDLDKDGKAEVIFGQSIANGGYAWAKPDPANPTAVWTPHPVWAAGQAVNGHGLGVGDVNADGRQDIVVPTGWYEQPASGIATSPWPFHAADLADPAVFGSGGGEMGVYDVNGDGLADVVAGTGHNWGLNWFEQKKDGTFVRHNIAQDFSTAATNMGGVVFSESHGARFADMNGDRIPDMITGKRYWSEAGNNVLTHNDPAGDPVLYIYRTVRDPKAPGGARFVPELVHNKSGVGSSFEVVDLNKDGRLDIVVATIFGTFTFTSTPAALPASPRSRSKEERHGQCPAENRSLLSYRARDRAGTAGRSAVQLRHRQLGDRGHHSRRHSRPRTDDDAQRRSDHPAAHHPHHQRLVRRDRPVPSHGRGGLLAPRPASGGRGGHEPQQEHRDVLRKLPAPQPPDAALCRRLAQDDDIGGPRSR
jgi:hypothetical protein